MRTILLGGEDVLEVEERRHLRAILGAASKDLGVGPGHVVIRFVDENEMRLLNQEWRGKDSPTDVLSFPSGIVDPEGRKHIGDIALCHALARRQARRRGHGAFRELALLSLHGLLHLLGYDHEKDEGEMDALEAGLRRRHLPPRNAR